MRVFQGGRNARQLEPVQQALAEFQRKKLIDVEYIDIDTVKMQYLTIQSIPYHYSYASGNHGITEMEYDRPCIRAAIII